MLPEVRQALEPFFAHTWANPASAHGAGRRARRALENAREQTAALVDARPDEVIFTSGATEANNLALFGLTGTPPGQIIVSPIEHPSVAEPVRQLAAQGFSVDPLPVDAVGRVAPAALAGLVSPSTRLVVVQLANHETGILQPIAELNAQLGASGPVLFHCDATQAVGKVPVSFQELGVTSLSFSAHKFHGPKGIGVLLLRHGTRLRPLTWGGHQQQGRRPGTEPVGLAVGLAKALELSRQDAVARTEHVTCLRRRFLEILQAAAAPMVLNGPAKGTPGYGIPHTLNLSFPGCQADAMLMNLDLADVACSTGSACSSGSLLPSPVLQAMQVLPENLASAMRFSLSALLTIAEIEEAARRIADIVRRLRSTATSQ
jgi:cysteine desulfurase